MWANVSRLSRIPILGPQLLEVGIVPLFNQLAVFFEVLNTAVYLANAFPKFEAGGWYFS